MTGHQINSLVGDLVAMAQAMERLPQCEHELKQAHSDINGYLATIQRLELKLIERANEIDTLNAKARSLEVERDEAQFHTLEADERTSRALDFIKATFGNAGSLIQALEPPTPPQPVTEQPKQAELEPQPQGESDRPLPATNTASAGEAAAASSGPSEDTVHTNTQPSPAPEVAAQPDPISAHTDGSGIGTEPAMPATDQSFSMPPIDKPYAGKTYSAAKQAAGSHFTWPNKDEWLDGGGTIDNFYA